MSAISFKPGDLAFIHCDDWFTAPDGSRRCGAYGPATILRAQDLLGFRPRNSADWFVQIGFGARAVLIAGCRIHYAIPFPSGCPRNPDIWDATGGHP